MEHDFENIQIKNILIKSKREMPFHNFEDELMCEIYKEHNKKRSVLKSIKLSWVFFIVGMISGIVLVSIYSQLNDISFDLTSSFSSLPLLIILLCLCIIMFADKLVRFSFFKDR